MFSKVYSHKGSFWHQEETIPFDELILSWNGERPEGTWTFYVSLQSDSWLKLATWSKEDQSTFQGSATFSRNEQDIIFSDKLCTSFKVRVEGEELHKLHTLHACVSNTALYRCNLPSQELPSICLENIPLQSQQVLPHPRHKELCSPTSTSIVLSFFLKKTVDPLQLAKQAYDFGFDIYGNWIFNIAEAYNQSKISCWVERLSGFEELHQKLLQKIPVVVSVKGVIPGAAKEYPQGHLICIIGYDKGKVFCVDPAFSSNEQTYRSYRLEDFLNAWSLRRNLSYVFSPSH
jgi:hypothetical protein